jgi:hypothetical protein
VKYSDMCMVVLVGGSVFPDDDGGGHRRNMSEYSLTCVSMRTVLDQLVNNNITISSVFSGA